MASVTALPTVGINDATTGTIAWETPGNIVSDNALYAAITNNIASPAISQILEGSSFGFAISAEATINGIVLEIERYAESVDRILDNEVRLLTAAGAAGVSNKASAVYWPGGSANIAIATYGSSSDLWGNTWAPADINDVDFGAMLTVSSNPAGGSGRKPFVDFMRLTVYYTDAISTVVNAMRMVA